MENIIDKLQEYIDQNRLDVSLDFYNKLKKFISEQTGDDNPSFNIGCVGNEVNIDIDFAIQDPSKYVDEGRNKFIESAKKLVPNSTVAIHDEQIGIYFTPDNFDMFEIRT
jgi:hypothetical protein